MRDDQLTTINGLLANPPPFDPSSSDQLGLFVAGQLAKRHDIKISMRPSPYGGTTAIVLIPRNLVVTEEDQARDPALAAIAGSAPRIKGRHGTRGLAAPAISAETSPDALAMPPSAAPSSWPGIEVPAMRDPAEAAGLDAAGSSRSGPGGPGSAGPGAGSFGPGLGGPGSAGPGSFDPGAGGFGPGLGGPGSAGPGSFDPGAGGFGPGAGGFGPGGLGVGEPDTSDLPRRIRQANLAPQLRESTIDPLPAPVAEPGRRTGAGGGPLDHDGHPARLGARPVDLRSARSARAGPGQR